MGQVTGVFPQVYTSVAAVLLCYILYTFKVSYMHQDTKAISLKVKTYLAINPILILVQIQNIKGALCNLLRAYKHTDTGLLIQEKARNIVGLEQKEHIAHLEIQ